MYKSLFECDLAIGQRHDTAVVLGWYPLNKFVQEFDRTVYGVAGNLFNPTHGVELLIRNLLFNTQIKNVLICDLTKEDKANKPGKVLAHAVANTPILRENLNVFIATSHNELNWAIKTIESTEMDLTPSRERVIKESLVEIDNKIIPGNIYSQVITRSTIEVAFPEVVKQIRSHGRMVADIQEYLNLNIVMTDEGKTISELLSHVPSDLRDSLNSYINDFLFGTKSVHSYSYGDRLLENNQPQNVIDKLTEKPLTMAGMMSIWYPEDLKKGNSPCLTQIWVRAFENKLDMTATFRSNDMFRAWQFNAYSLRALQIKIADSLKLEPGVLSTVSFSAHIYQKDFEEIAVFLNKSEPKKDKTPKTFYSVVGNFVITQVETTAILVKQFDNNGKFVKDWKVNRTNKQVWDLIDQICNENPSIETAHALYLQRELLRAISPGFKQR